MSVFEVILVRIFSRIFLHSDWYSVRMQENAGKNADQNNSEYGYFLGSAL